MLPVTPLSTIIPPEPPPPEPPKGLLVNLRNKFLAGLVFAIPLIATFWIINTVFQILQAMSAPLTDAILGVINAIFGLDGPAALREDSISLDLGYVYIKPISLIIPIIVLVLLGTMLKYVLGRRIADAMDYLLLRIPLVSAVYKTVKQTMDAFKSFGGSSGQKSFKRVVYIQIGGGQHTQIGFVTGHFTEPSTGRMMTTVFLPFALTPYTGFLYVVDEAHITDSGLSLEDAMKLIFSGGLVSPNVIVHSNLPSPHPGVMRDTARMRLRTPWGTSTDPNQLDAENDNRDDSGAGDVPGEIVTLPETARPGEGFRRFISRIRHRKKPK